MWTCRDGDRGRMSFYVLGEFAICTVSHSYRAGDVHRENGENEFNLKFDVLAAELFPGFI